MQMAHCILGTMDHDCCCTLEWILQQCHSSFPNPSITVAFLTERYHFLFNFLLTWEYWVWVMQLLYYYEYWTYTCTITSPMWWLGAVVASHKSKLTNFPSWSDLNDIPPLHGPSGLPGLNPITPIPHDSCHTVTTPPNYATPSTQHPPNPSPVCQ